MGVVRAHMTDILAPIFCPNYTLPSDVSNNDRTKINGVPWADGLEGLDASAMAEYTEEDAVTLQANVNQKLTRAKYQHETQAVIKFVETSKATQNSWAEKNPGEKVIDHDCRKALDALILAMDNNASRMIERCNIPSQSYPENNDFVSAADLESGEEYARALRPRRDPWTDVSFSSPWSS